MSAEQDFLAFAIGGGANVISQATYASLAALSPGFSTGIAASNQVNKVLRQSSTIASVVAQLIADVTGQTVLDNGAPSTIEQNLLLALALAGYQTDTGVANAYALTFTPSLALTTGMTVKFLAGHANTGASTLAVNGSSPKAIVGLDGNPLIGGEIRGGGLVIATFNGTSFVLPTYSNSAWHDVSGSRSLGGGPYGNTHNKPIQASVTVYSASAAANLTVLVGGVTIGSEGSATAGSTVNMTFDIPIGSNYEVTSTGGGVISWTEKY